MLWRYGLGYPKKITINQIYYKAGLMYIRYGGKIQDRHNTSI